MLLAGMLHTIYKSRVIGTDVKNLYGLRDLLTNSISEAVKPPPTPNEHGDNALHSSRDLQVTLSVSVPI